ncbi:DUF6538 domain-containing protein [Ralstonia nicotianae]|nr:site-specific integrase [Ralstonia solanacearum]
MATNIQKRGTVYYFRRKIPLHLIEQYGGKREVIRSLGTKDRAEAERLARKISVELDDEWQAVKPRPPMWPDNTDFVEVAGKLIPIHAGVTPAPQRVSQTEADAAELPDQEAADLCLQDAFAEEAAEEEADKLMRVIGIVERRRAEAGLGPIPQAVRAAVAPQSRSGATKAAKQTTSGTSLESLVPIWQKERKPTTKTLQSAMRTVAELGDPDVSTVTRQAIIAYRDKLLDAGKATNTINTRLSFIRILLGIAKDRGLVEVNHADDTALAENKRAVDLRKPYSPEQVSAVMAATEGMKASLPAMYWLPRLARWTGARLNELHQLRKEDVQAREGVPGLMIHDEGEHAPGVALRLKNQGSRRWVPLAEPVRDFAEWAAARAEGPLFPAKPNKFGIVSDGFSKRYGRFLREALKIKDKRITFHSWRHTFADMCRAAAVPAEVRMVLMGHAEGGVSGTYGAGDGLPARRLIEAMAQLAVHGGPAG